MLWSRHIAGPAVCITIEVFAWILVNVCGLGDRTQTHQGVMLKPGVSAVPLTVVAMLLGSFQANITIQLSMFTQALFP